MHDQDDFFMRQALSMAQQGIELGHGGPFGAVVTLDGKIIGQAWNQVVQLNDPTAHAEMLAIRSACESVNSFHLPHATLYTTCEPCPMCMGAIYWARVSRLVYGATAMDASDIGFSDQWMKDELHKPLENRSLQTRQHMRAACKKLFTRWQLSERRIDY